jgi:hypothetical protein
MKTWKSPCVGRKQCAKCGVYIAVCRKECQCGSHQFRRSKPQFYKKVMCSVRGGRGRKEHGETDAANRK